MKSVKDKLTKELLLSILKPARYIGAEIGSVKKDLSKIAVKVCLCFPDVYEIGMSHLGLRILYDLINRQKDFAAERVFSPWVDMEEKLKVERIPLFSLESAVPVGEFDILGFSLQYELSYANVLNVLSLAGIPLESRRRTQKHPLVIAGGICALNPEPMADFIDLFIIGEAEEVLLEILNFYKKYKVESGCSKSELLKLLSGIQGVYIPSYYRIEDETGARIVLDSHAPEKIHKCYIKDLNQLAPMETWIVPYIEIVHDRVGIEIMRGCPNNCVFCAVHVIWKHTWRSHSLERVLEEIDYFVKKGIKRINIQDDNFNISKERIIKICQAIVARKYNITFISSGTYFPTLDDEVLKWLKRAGFKSIRLSIESGNQEILDKIIRKRIDLSKVPSIVKSAQKIGLNVEGAFILGLPGETIKTMHDTVNFAKRAGFDYIRLFVYQPFPNTDAYEICKNKGYLTKDYDPECLFIVGNKCFVETEEFTPEDVLRIAKGFDELNLRN